MTQSTQVAAGFARLAQAINNLKVLSDGLSEQLAAGTPAEQAQLVVIAQNELILRSQAALAMSLFGLTGDMPSASDAQHELFFNQLGDPS